jgi:hypothetical protein
MCGRNLAEFTLRCVRLPIIPSSRARGEARRKVESTIVAALAGLLLSGPVVAAKQALAGESKLGASHRSETQDLQTTEQASKSVSRTETSVVGDAPGILPLLVVSPERRKLAKDVERLLQRSKIEEAESHLNNAVDIGTFAILLLDQLRTPSLLADLKALGLPDDDQSTVLSDAPEEPASPLPNGSGTRRTVSTSSELAEWKIARDREQQRADGLSRDLATVTEELHALQALRAQEAASAVENAQRWAELTASFEKERQRADAVARDLAVLAEERHALQQLREQEAVFAAYNRRELKEELGRERLRNQAAAAMRQKAEQSQSSKSGEPIDMESLALSHEVSSPGSLPVRVAAVQANTYRLHGIPNVVDAATLSLQGRTVRLVGVQTDGDASSANELNRYLDGREVNCEPAGPTDVYRCQVDGIDLSMVVLFNGGGRAAPDATLGLTLAADKARSARVGVWSK